MQHLKPETKTTWFSFFDLVPDDATLDRLTSLADRFIAWFGVQFTQPQTTQNTAWIPEQLEYQASCALPKNEKQEKIITASEYYQGRLNWYNFDIDDSRSQLSRPVAVSYPHLDVYKRQTEGYLKCLTHFAIG